MARQGSGGNQLMYAIFETGGKQYKVAAGDVIRVEKLPEAEGKNIKFDKVLAVNDGKQTHIGTPYLDAATVDATVTAVGKAEKVIVFKFKAKKDYRKKQGHRQPFTEIEIERVSLDGKTVFKKEAPKEAEKPAPEKKDGEPSEEKSEDKEKTETISDEDKTDKEALVKDEKPEEAKAEAPEAEADEENAAEAPEAEADEEDAAEAPEAEADEDKTPEKPEAADAPKLKKADIIAKLDELGIEYQKSAKKGELLAILEEAEK
jgi:large subunit ribosomal protein L21